MKTINIQPTACDERYGYIFNNTERLIILKLVNIEIAKLEQKTEQQ